MRHTTATHMLEAGVPLMETSRIIFKRNSFQKICGRGLPLWIIGWISIPKPSPVPFSDMLYKKYVAEAREQHPEMFLQSKYTPHTMRHTTATHMLHIPHTQMSVSPKDAPRYGRTGASS